MWKVLPEFPTYEASTEGHVRKISNQHVCSESYDDHGYIKINLRYNNKPYTRRVHTLIAQAYLEKPSRTNQVNHIDGNKNNNALHNLEMTSQSGNQIHAVNNYLKPRKLTDGDVLAIRESALNGANQTLLSKQYNVSASMISFIKLGKRYKHVI